MLISQPLKEFGIFDLLQLHSELLKSPSHHFSRPSAEINYLDVSGTVPQLQARRSSKIHKPCIFNIYHPEIKTSV